MAADINALIAALQTPFGRTVAQLAQGRRRGGSAMLMSDPVGMGRLEANRAYAMDVLGRMAAVSGGGGGGGGPMAGGAMTGAEQEAAMNAGMQNAWRDNPLVDYFLGNRHQARVAAEAGREAGVEAMLSAALGGGGGGAAPIY